MDTIIVGHKGCSVEKVILTIMATPPEISGDNIHEIIRSLGTPQEKKQKITQCLADGVNKTFDALQEVLYEWVARKSINATLEVLIFHLKKCNLNSYADALDLKFSTLVSETSRKNSVSSDANAEDFSSFDYDCQSTVNSDQPFFQPLNMENVREGQRAFKDQSQMCLLPFLVIILLALTGTLFVMMLQNFGIFQTSMLAEDNNLYNSNFSAPIFADTTANVDFVITNLSRNGHICPMPNTKINVSVKTYDEFQRLTSTLTSCDSISLHVDLSIKEAWPQNPNLSSSQIIDVSLSGPFGIGKVIELLKSAPVINTLRLNNSQNLLCLENSHHSSLFENIRNCDMNIYHLQNLYLDNFVDCEYVLDMILTCIKPKLSVFEFSGIITDANAQQLFHIMQSSYITMKEIKIVGEYGTSAGFLPIHTPMLLLRTLNINVVPKSNQYIHNTILVENFCTVFKGINKFVLKGQQSSHQQLLNLINCTELRELVIYVAFDLGRNMFEHLNFSKWFPLLSELDIALNFQNCPNLNKLDALINEISKIPRMCVSSNCVLSTNRNMGGTNLARKMCSSRHSISIR